MSEKRTIYVQKMKEAICKVCTSWTSYSEKCKKLCAYATRLCTEIDFIAQPVESAEIIAKEEMHRVYFEKGHPHPLRAELENFESEIAALKKELEECAVNNLRLRSEIINSDKRDIAMRIWQLESEISSLKTQHEKELRVLATKLQQIGCDACDHYDNCDVDVLVAQGKEKCVTELFAYAKQEAEK